jgi:hypothetical protein
MIRDDWLLWVSIVWLVCLTVRSGSRGIADAVISEASADAWRHCCQPAPIGQRNSPVEFEGLGHRVGVKALGLPTVHPGHEWISRLERRCGAQRPQIENTL